MPFTMQELYHNATQAVRYCQQTNTPVLKDWSYHLLACVKA